MTTPTNRFLRACHGLPVDAMPVWLMRQAGRYMPEYRAIRDRYSILEIIANPEVACAVSLQPIDAFAVDAAIIFSDILPPLQRLGFELSYIHGEGPHIANPVRTARDLDRLRPLDSDPAADPTVTAVRLLSTTLQARDIPVIGFAGAPYTLAAYAIEGEGGTQRQRLKALMYEDPTTWHALLNTLAVLAGQHLVAQAHAGAQVLQLFDSWVGDLSPYDYRTYVLPHTQRTISIAHTAGVPVIHFGTGNAGLLPALTETGANIYGIDWRIDIPTARTLLPPNAITQGNFDPALLFAPWPVIRAQTEAGIAALGAQPRHIANLGHGILQHTPVENVRMFVDLIHDLTRIRHA